MDDASWKQRLDEVVIALRDEAVRRWQKNGRWQDAEDFGQEVALAVLRRASRFEGKNGASLKTYLSAAVKTVPWDCLKKMRLYREYLARFLAEDPRSRAIQRELRSYEDE